MRNQSIHERVVNGRTRYEKVSTAKNKNPDRIAALKERMQKHMDEHPRDAATQAHFNKL